MSALTFDPNQRITTSTNAIGAYSNGLPFDSAGALAVTDAVSAPNTMQGGFPFEADGTIAVDSSSAEYVVQNGLPLTEAGRIAVDSFNAVANFQNGLPLTTDKLAVTDGGLWYGADALELNGIAPSFIHQYANNRYYNTQDGATGFPFTATRTTNAMMYDVQGRLVFAPANMLINTTGFTTSWTKQNCSITNTGLTDPLGGTNGVEITDATTGAALYQSNGTIASLQNYTGSVYIKRGNTDFFTLRYLESGFSNGIRAQINLVTGAVSSVSAVGSGVGLSVAATDAGSGWWRIAISGMTGSGATTGTIEFHTATSIASPTPVVGGTYYVFGAQLEPYDVASPKTYVATGASAYFGPRLEYNPSGTPTYINVGSQLIDDPSCNDPAKWLAGAGWEVTGGQLVATAAAGAGIEQTTVAFVSGQMYRVRFDYNLSAGGTNIIVYRGQGVQQIGTAINGGSGTGAFDVIFTANGGANKLLFQATGGINATIDNVSVYNVTPQYLPAGLLIEDSRTNLVPASLNIPLASMTELAVVRSASPATYLGGWSAVRLTSNAVNTAHGAYPASIVPTASSSVGLQAIIKSISADTFYQLTGSGNWLLDLNGYANFQLTGAGSVTATGSSASSAFIRYLGDGVYHIGVNVTTSAAPASGAACIIGCITTGTDLRLPTNTSAAVFDFIYGGIYQSQAGWASVLPTFGVSATRGTDVATQAIGSWLDQTKGTMYCEFIRSYVSTGTGNSQTFAQISDGTNNNRMVMLSGIGTHASHRFDILSGGIAQGQPTATSTATAFTTRKMVGTYQASGFRACENGGTVGSTGAGTVPGASNRLDIGCALTAAQLNGWVQEFRYYPDVSASNAQLQTLTT